MYCLSVRLGILLFPFHTPADAISCKSFLKNMFSFSVAVQPAKQFFITLLVNNTEAEDIVLAPGDSLPASGYIMKGHSCSRIVKRLRNPSAVKFRVWGVTTDKPFLLNGEREISVVPSDYDHDVTDVAVKMVKPGGKCTHLRISRCFWNVSLDVFYDA